MNDSTWTWMSGSDSNDQTGVYGTQGSPDIDNVPGARDSAGGWYDLSTQEFWLFGGKGYASDASFPGTYSFFFSLHEQHRSNSD